MVRESRKERKEDGGRLFFVVVFAATTDTGVARPADREMRKRAGKKPLAVSPLARWHTSPAKQQPWGESMPSDRVGLSDREALVAQKKSRNQNRAEENYKERNPKKRKRNE